MNKHFQNPKYLKSIYKDPKLIKFRGEFLKKYSKKKYSTRTLILGLLPGLINKNILDIGCGNCSFITKLHKLYPSNNYYGLDIVKNNRCNKLKYVNFRIYDGKTFPEYKCAFDIILCMHTLYHIANFKNFFSWIKKNLNKKRIIIITTKSKDTLPKIEKIFLKIIEELKLNKKFHISQHRDEERFCMENGIKILKKYFSFKHFNIKRYIITNQISVRNKNELLKYILSTQRYNILKNMKNKNNVRNYISYWKEKISRHKTFMDDNITAVYILNKKI